MGGFPGGAGVALRRRRYKVDDQAPARLETITN
jgi:hypothetical protein